MSQGLYSHTTRGTGTVLTAAIYNSDHTNHISNHNPSMMGAYSDTLNQFQLVTDPGGVGTELFAAFLGEELSHIRFCLKRITGKTHWYEAPSNNFETLFQAFGARRTITGADTVVASDKGDIVEATSGTFSLALTAAATLGDGFWVAIYNSGTGTVTLDPNGAELIDGAATADLLPGQTVLVFCTGSAFETIRLGDVAGAGTVTDGHAAVFDGTTGRKIKTAGGSPVLSIALQVFTGSGTYTPAAGMKFALVISTGGGGGGGGADGSDTSMNANGGGGAAGGTAIEMFDAATIGASQTVTIGAAGAAGADTGGDGGAGGNTTFGALHTATGGEGGQGVLTSTNLIATTVANGGVPTGGALNITGGDGHFGTIGDPSSSGLLSAGNGGASVWGGGGSGVSRNGGSGSVTGSAGSAYGSGGGGAVCRDSTSGSAGGAGAAGLVIVLEFVA